MKSFVVAALAAAAAASPWSPLPVETGHAVFDLDEGMSPMPTMAPLLADAVGLKKRLLFQDRTCGFTEGNADEPDLCQSGLTCAVNRASDAIACCSNLSSCGVYTGCLDRASLTCTTSGCSSRANYLSCTDIASPYCAFWEYELGVNTAYYYTCARSVFTVTVLTTTTASTSSQSSFVLSTSKSSTVSSSEKSTSSGASIDTLTPTPTPAPAKKSNVGAIVGGVVGGLGGLALIGLGACFLLTRKKKNPPPQQQAQTPYVPPGGQPPAYPPQQKDYYGNPVASPVQGMQSPAPMAYGQPQQPMMQQVPSPGGMSYPTPPQGYATPGYGAPQQGYAAGYAGTPPAPVAGGSPMYHQQNASPVSQGVASPVPPADQRYSQQNFTAVSPRAPGNADLQELPAGNYK